MNEPLSLHDIEFHITYYKFWNSKDKFLLYEHEKNDKWIYFAVEDGSFEYEIADKKGIASLGDIVICPPQQSFRRIVISPLTFHHYEGVWKYRGKTLDQAEAARLPYGKISIADVDRLKQNYHMLKNLGFGWNSPFLRTFNHYIMDIWYLYCNEVEPLAPKHTLPYDSKMEQAKKLIMRQASQHLHLKAVAETLNMSQTAFTQKFKRAFGCAPIQFLSQLRLEKAMKLLVETKLKLDDIAECCGYQNGVYLNRVFKKQMNMTPGQYRKKYRV